LPGGRSWDELRGARYEIEVWAWWNNVAGVWEVDFERRDGGSSVKEFRAAIAEHRSLREHRQAAVVAIRARHGYVRLCWWRACSPGT
jgi:hypothetical protein